MFKIISLNLPRRRRVLLGYSHLLLRLFLGVVLFISFSRCGGGEDEPTPTPKLDTPTIKPDNTNPAVKSKEVLISNLVLQISAEAETIDFDQDGNASIVFPYGITFPSHVTIKTLEHSPKAVPSVPQGGVLTVNDGKTTITITAEDETATKTYTINFVYLPPPSTEASISKINFTVNGKNYDASIAEEEVTVNLPYNESIPPEVTITTLEHAPDASPSVQQGGALTISDGGATITITAEDGTTTKTYTINFVNLPPSTEASISKISFTVNGKNYDVSNSEEEVTVNLPYNESIPPEITITTLEHAPEAEPSVQQGGALTVSDERATITVTAEDGTTTKTYTINFVITATVTFDVNGDITAIPPLIVNKEDKANRPTDPTPTTGKSFGYWATASGIENANYGNHSFDFETTPINEDITLYAVWQEKPKTKTALITLIIQAINSQGDSPNLNFIDTGLITDMSYLLQFQSSFNGDISGWDTSKVTDMSYMFANASTFNNDIGDWDTSKVINMEGMFATANAFNNDIGDWDTSKVTNMEGVFYYANAFNKDIGDWDTSQVTNMSQMFSNARAFNKDISEWKVAKVTNHDYAFYNCPIDNDHKPTFPNN